MSLRDGGTCQPLVPIVVMAIGAGEIELALTLHVQAAAFCDEGLELRIAAGRDRSAAGLLRDERRERQQIADFIGERRGLLLAGAAQIDALLEIDGAAERLVEGGVSGRDTLHAGSDIAMAIRAGLVSAASLFLPEGFAVERPEHGGIGGVVVLHRHGVRCHEGGTGAALGFRDFRGRNARGGHQRHQRYRAQRPHSTDMEAEAVSENPLSPIHSNSNLPLSVAVVKKVMKGLAATAGNRSARKISLPLKRHVKLVMMSRGTTSPEALWR